MNMKKRMLTLVVLALLLQLHGSYGRPQVPCFFILGDSLSDSGNNNNLQTVAKANFKPYGIDFPGGPTGRFTNGRTTVDLIGDHLGLEGYIPSFASMKDSDVHHIIKGVNYASGSSGIRPETGSQVGMRVNFDQQLRNHKTIVSKIRTRLGKNSTAHLSKCLYSVYVGSNDWMLNYFGGGSARLRYTTSAYADALLNQLSQQLTTLYHTGARKIILFGLGPLGCLPPIAPLGVCSSYINNVLEMYNTKLKSLVKTLNAKFKDAKFIWINTIAIVSKDLRGLGLKVRTTPCCGGGGACLPVSIPCSNRGDYAYWDPAHPTEAANKVLARRAFTAKQKTDVYPMDISHLARLNIRQK